MLHVVLQLSDLLGTSGSAHPPAEYQTVVLEKRHGVGYQPTALGCCSNKSCTSSLRAMDVFPYNALQCLLFFCFKNRLQGVFFVFAYKYKLQVVTPQALLPDMRAAPEYA